MDLTEELLNIKKQIDEAIPEQSEIKGKIKSEEERVEKQFGVKTISGMEDKLKEIGEKIDDEETEFKNGMQELKDAYSWGIRNENIR